MKTADCTRVWELITQVKLYDEELASELQDAFCDFECAWKEHAEEYHTNKEERR